MVRTLKYITLLLLLPVCSSTVMAQVGLSIHDTSAVSGNKLTIPVYVDTSLTGKNVTSYKIQLGYYAPYMALDSVITTGTMSQSLGTVSYNNLTPGTLTIAVAGSTPLSGTGILIFVRFRLLVASYATLSFTGGTANNFFNEGSPAMVTRNGTITIQPAPTITISPSSSLLTVGDHQQFTAYSGKIPYHWSLTNPSVASIDSNGLLTATLGGFTRVVARDSAGTIDTINGLVEVRSFRLSVRDTSCLQGQTFNIPVYTSDLTGLNITSGSFQIQFNQNILTPIGVVQTGTLLASYPGGAFSNGVSGILNFSFAGSTSLSGSGILAFVQFKVSKTTTGGSTIYPANIVFNENVRGDSATGLFQTINLAHLNVSPLTGNLIVGDTLRFTASGGTPPYSWSISDSTVASINNTGLLTAVKGGSVIVQAVDVYGGSGVSGSIQIYDTRVSVADTIGKIGDSIDVPIYVSPLLAGMHVQSLQATITYDTSVIHAVGIVTAGTITNGWTYSTNISGTQIVFAAASVTDLPSSGALCKIRFAVPLYVTSGRSSSLSIQQFLFNEGSPRVYSVNGRVTASPGSLPAAPTGLNAVTIDYGKIYLTWLDNAVNETGYAVQRTTDTTASWSTITTLPANAVADSDKGLVDGTRYFYRVLASNGSGNSNPSNVSGATTPMIPPTGLAANQIVGEKIRRTWQDNSNSELGYYVERKLGSTGTYVVIDSVGANVSTFTDSTGVPSNEYFYRVRGHNLRVTSAYSNEVNLILTGSKSDLADVPARFDLSQNYPNPFNPSTNISYQVPVVGHITLKIFDSLGREVATLVNGTSSPGYYDATFNAEKLPSGIYFYRLTASGYVSVKKMVLMK
jgi:Secretion system C-terminal sorting domain/Cohesin domain/Bacterial Ig-like domain (group 2)